MSKEELPIPEDLYAAFIGKETPHFLPYFQRLIALGRISPSLNLWAFLWGSLWFFYRRIILAGIIYTILTFLSFFLYDCYYFELTKLSRVLIILFVPIAGGVVANYIYYIHAKKRLTIILNNKDIEDKVAAAEAAGGTCMGNVIFALAVVSLLSLFT